MKQLMKTDRLKSFVALLTLCLIQTVLWAQEGGDGGSSGSSTTTKTSVKVTEDTTWYTAPWVWVVGAAVFILLLVALTRSGRSTDTRSSDRVTVTKEVRRDSDV